MEIYERLIAQLGLSGAWLQVTRDSLVSTDTTIIPTGCYFLAWDRKAIVFAHIPGAGDLVQWVSAHNLLPAEDWLPGVGTVEHWQSSFQALRIWSSRSELLRECGFTQHERPFVFMALVPSKWPR
jgi:hypothetical protein